MKIKDEIENLWDNVKRLKDEVYGYRSFDGIKFDLNQITKRQNVLEKKLDMLMDYLNVEEKHEPEKRYIDRRDNED